MAIDDELVFITAGRQRQILDPVAVTNIGQRRFSWVPVIKRTGHKHFVRVWLNEHKADGTARYGHFSFSGGCRGRLFVAVHSLGQSNPRIVALYLRSASIEVPSNMTSAMRRAAFS